MLKLAVFLLLSIAAESPALAGRCPNGDWGGADPEVGDVCNNYGQDPNGKLPAPPAPPPPAPPAPPLPPSPPAPKEETLGLTFTFTSAADCEARLGKVSVASIEIPQSETAAEYCARLFPTDLKVAPITVMFPAVFTFTDENDCVAKTTDDLVPSGAKPKFPSDETAEQYCAGLFPSNPPPRDPPKAPSPHKGQTCSETTRVPPEESYVPQSYGDCESYYCGHYLPVWECNAIPPPNIKPLTQAYLDWTGAHCSSFGWDTRVLDPSEQCSQAFP